MLQRITTNHRLNAAEGVRDVFGRILDVATKTSDTLNLCHILIYPITAVPLSLALSDGTPLKADKATLTKALEDKQDIVLADAIISPIKATVIDGGIILHETMIQHSKSTYGSMARDLLERVCHSYGENILLVLDKYQSPSIITLSEFYAGRPQEFIITGPDQAQRQSGTELLKNGGFKEEFASFIMKEWNKPQYGSSGGFRIFKRGGGGANFGASVN